MIYPDNWLNRGIAIFSLVSTVVALVLGLVQFYRTARLPEHRVKFGRTFGVILFEISIAILLVVASLFESLTRPGLLSAQQISVLFLSLIIFMLLTVITGLLKNDRPAPPSPS